MDPRSFFIFELKAQLNAAKTKHVSRSRQLLAHN